MMTHNRQILIGYVGADPDLRYTNDQKAVVNLSVATNEKNGEEVRTTWHRVVAWGKTAEYVSEYVKKGSLLYVEGPTYHRPYETKSGEKRTSTEVSATLLILLSAPKADKTERAPEEGDEGDEY